MDYYFKDEVIHDLAVHKEFVRSYQHSSTIRSVFNLLYCLLLIWFISKFSLAKIVYYYLVIALVFLIVHLLTHPKNGDINYKRMLQSNNGQPIHWVFTFCDDGIHCTCPQNGNNSEYRYDQFRRMIESEHLLLLVMKYRTCLVLDKRWLQGCTAGELTAFLLERCPNIRGKKPKKTTFGRWSQRLLGATLIIGTLIALLNFPGYSLWHRLTGLLHNDMSYQEMADDLQSLDITISQRAIDEMETYDAEYYETYGEDYYAGSYINTKIFDLLYCEGSGAYNEETWEWTPSTSGVYWVESEVWNVDSMYTDFLTGLSAMHEDLNFTNIREDHSNADQENGSGTILVSFDWNGTHHQLEAELNYDWFDTDVLYAVGRIIAGDDNSKDLYFSSDNGWGYLLYYGDADQMRQLAAKTGLRFNDTVIMLIGH